MQQVTGIRCTYMRWSLRFVNRQDIFVNEATQEVQVVPGSLPIPPESWETGFKDTVIAYPGQVTRIRAQFNTPGQFVWHCHIVEHEDNEMMRPYRIGPVQPAQPQPMAHAAGAGDPTTTRTSSCPSSDRNKPAQGTERCQVVPTISTVPQSGPAAAGPDCVLEPSAAPRTERR